MVHDPRSDKGRSERLESVTSKEFKKVFKNFPKGNPASTFSALRYAVAFEMTFFGEHVTKDMIYESWDKYLKTCIAEERENRYIKSLESFIKAKDYQNEEPEEKKESWLDKLKKGNQDDDYKL